MSQAIEDGALTVRIVPLSELSPNPRNARLHPADQVDQIAASMREFGFTNPILADLDDGGIIVAGHGRRLAALKLMAADELLKLPSGRILPKGAVPVIDCSGWTEAQRRAYTLADNRLAETSEWDNDLLSLELVFLKDEGFEFELTGFDAKDLDKLLGIEAPGDEKATGSLSDRFGVPPFSVLNAREGWWQDRKRQWLALGIQSEVGRGENLLRFSDTINEPDPEKRKAKNGKRKAATFGQDIMRGEHVVGEAGGKPIKTIGTTDWMRQKGLSGGASDGDPAVASGTSIFDPVLCELAYRWFCPPGGTILDPFAGGSVRGIVASKLGRLYVGGELRPEQVEANRDQASRICEPGLMPVWNIGDSRNIQETCAGTEADFVFS